MERQGYVKVFEHRFEHATATHLLFAQLGLVLVFLGHFHAERGQVLRVAGEHIMRGGIGDGHCDRAASAGNTLDQRVHLRAGDVFDRQHRRGFAVTCGKTKLTCLTGAGNTDQRGNRKNFIDLYGSRLNGTCFNDRLHHVHGEHALGVAEHGHRLGNGGIVAERSSVKQRTQLGERNARLAEAAAAAPSRAGFGSNPNRSTGRPVVASRSAATGYSSAWAASTWACSASLSIGLALWSASATGHGVDCPAKASACGSPFSRSRKKVFMMFLTCFKNLAMCSSD